MSTSSPLWHITTDGCSSSDLWPFVYRLASFHQVTGFPMRVQTSWLTGGYNQKWLGIKPSKGGWPELKWQVHRSMPLEVALFPFMNRHSCVYQSSRLCVCVCVCVLACLSLYVFVLCSNSFFLADGASGKIWQCILWKSRYGLEVNKYSAELTMVRG